MTPDELESDHGARLERARASIELTREMLWRSREQLATSQMLLRIEVPKVWHPEPTEAHGTSSLVFW
jgi:hypothetical protein